MNAPGYDILSPTGFPLLAQDPAEKAHQLDKNIFLRASLVICLWLIALFCPSVYGSSYEAPLPAQLSTDPDLCAYAPCKDVLPGADRFSVRKGRPSYVEAYKDKQLLGYVFLSTDIVDIPAYSGKPVVTLLGMDTQGKIVGVKILKHSEPILLVGIPETELTKFIKQFVGRYAWDKVEIGKARQAEGRRRPDPWQQRLW